MKKKTKQLIENIKYIISKSYPFLSKKEKNNILENFIYESLLNQVNEINYNGNGVVPTSAPVQNIPRISQVRKPIIKAPNPSGIVGPGSVKGYVPNSGKGNTLATPANGINYPYDNTEINGLSYGTKFGPQSENTKRYKLKRIY